MGGGEPGMAKTRILMLIQGFPTISQTYQVNEVEAVMDDYDVRVLSAKGIDSLCKRHPPYESVSIKDLTRIREVIREFRPDVLHAHYFHYAPLMAQLGEEFGLPFTIRTHSYDALKASARRRPFGHREVRAVNSDLCAGVLGFPFLRPMLERIGVRSDRFVDCFPVIKYDRFYDRSANGEAILNVGACIAKKRMEDFVDLGKLTEKSLNLYAIGYTSDELIHYNEQNGSPITLRPIVEAEEMPAVFKAHGWLVYTACPKLKTVGWPLSVAEAQASGLGVCLPNIRPDMADYLGGAGFLYDSIGEVPAIIEQPYPDEMREIGFEHAKKSDIARHKHLLTDLWDRAAGQTHVPSPAAGSPLGAIKRAIGLS